MFRNIISAALVAAFVFLGTPAFAADFQSIQLSRYDNASTHSRKGGHKQRRHHRLAGGSITPSYHPRTMGPRPAKWCGWWARHQKGVDNPGYNRAIYWLNYGKPTSPQVGAVVVWSHHVGIITGRDHRGWLVTSGNWNNRVATVPLSQMGRGVRGYRI